MRNHWRYWAASTGLGVLVGLTAGCESPAVELAECPLGTLGCYCDSGACEGELVCDLTCGPADAPGTPTGGEGDGSSSEGSTSGDGDSDPNGSCLEPELTVSGEMHFELSSLAFDRVVAEVIHKRDIDAHEDGCISRVKLTLTYADACTLEVEARGILAQGNQLVVTSMSFESNSQCPGFPDAIEKNYAGMHGGLHGASRRGDIVNSAIELAQTHVDGTNTERSCLKGSMVLRPQGELYDEETGVVLAIGGEVVVSGSFDTQALTPELACPTTCGDGVIEGAEECEEKDVPATCASLYGFEAGELGCSPQCTYDTSKCVGEQPSSGLYSKCEMDEQCEEGMSCESGFCTMSCAVSGDCSAEVVGEPECNGGGFCTLACSASADCPLEMVCGEDAYCTSE